MTIIECYSTTKAIKGYKIYETNAAVSLPSPCWYKGYRAKRPQRTVLNNAAPLRKLLCGCQMTGYSGHENISNCMRVKNTLLSHYKSVRGGQDLQHYHTIAKKERPLSALQIEILIFLQQLIFFVENHICIERWRWESSHNDPFPVLALNQENIRLLLSFCSCCCSKKHRLFRGNILK